MSDKEAERGTSVKSPKGKSVYCATAKTGLRKTATTLSEAAPGMAVIIQGDISRNELRVPSGFLEQSSGVIRFSGTESVVSVGAGTSGYAISVTVEHGCTVSIGKDCALGALEVFSVRGSTILIGDRNGFTSHAEIHAHEKNTISLGNGCLIASNVWLTSSDMHPIIDLETNKRINHGQDIFISDRVWIANKATILKGVHVGSGSIIGTGAILTSSIEPNCLAVGNPARVVRRNVSWNHHL